MDATQFIKEHGIKKAREVVDGAPEHWTTYTAGDGLGGGYIRCSGSVGQDEVPISDLKRIVESVELVEHFGNDLVGAKQLLEFSKDCKTIELSGSVITIERLEQAIADYGSIYLGAES